MDKHEKKAWKILIKAAKLKINIDDELIKATGKKTTLDITAGEVISWAATFGHPQLNLFLKELNVPIWQTTKDEKIAYIDAYLHGDWENASDLASQLGKLEDEDFMRNFRHALYKVKLQLAVWPNGKTKIVKLDDRIIYEEGVKK